MKEKNPSTLYAQIAQGIEDLVNAGTLRSGDRIPSIRQLSRQHKVSAPTVLQAYTVLENRRLIEARPRSGFFVRSRISSQLKSPLLARHNPAPQSLAGFPPLMSMVSDITNPQFVPMGGANPSAELLPSTKLARIIASIARRQPHVTVNYDPVPGCPSLRQEISRRSLDWGCYLQPDDFVLTFGATEALFLALSAVTQPGDTVICESPTYYGLLNIFSQLRLKTISVPATEAGLDIEAAEAALKKEKVAAIVVIPNFSNPLGGMMPETARLRLLDLAADHGVPIIEDDIYGDLHHHGNRPRCLKALDKTSSVILCGSFSKTLAPGYRAGFVAAGPHGDKITRIKSAMNFGSSPLPLMAIAEFLRNGGYDHHLRTLRRTFREQVRRMRAALISALPPDTKISTPSGGFVLWVELPESVDAVDLFHAARQANISIAPGHLFSPAAEYKNFIRVSCGHPWSPQIEDAVHTLGRLVNQMIQK